MTRNLIQFKESRTTTNGVKSWDHVNPDGPFQLWFFPGRRGVSLPQQGVKLVAPGMQALVRVGEMQRRR